MNHAQQIWNYLNIQVSPALNLVSDGFKTLKKRHKVHQYTRHGETGSISKNVKEEIKDLCTYEGEFREENIYNMDETELYWRMTPSKAAPPVLSPGSKRTK